MSPYARGFFSSFFLGGLSNKGFACNGTLPLVSKMTRDDDGACRYVRRSGSYEQLG